VESRKNNKNHFTRAVVLITVILNK